MYDALTLVSRASRVAALLLAVAIIVKAVPIIVEDDNAAADLLDLMRFDYTYCVKWAEEHGVRPSDGFWNDTLHSLRYLNGRVYLNMTFCTPMAFYIESVIVHENKHYKLGEYYEIYVGKRIPSGVNMILIDVTEAVTKIKSGYISVKLRIPDIMWGSRPTDVEVSEPIRFELEWPG